MNYFFEILTKNNNSPFKYQKKIYFFGEIGNSPIFNDALYFTQCQIILHYVDKKKY